jgi:hypothetical protein
LPLNKKIKRRKKQVERTPHPKNAFGEQCLALFAIETLQKMISLGSVVGAFFVHPYARFTITAPAASNKIANARNIPRLL